MLKRSRHLYFGIVLLVALTAGAAAGIVASVTLARSLGDYAAQLFLAQVPATPSSAVSRANPSSYDGALERVATVALPSVVLVTASTIDTRSASSWIDETDAFGYGVVVSTDGWILLTDDVLDSVANPITQTDVWIDGVRYDMTQVVRDSLTDFVLVKVAGNGLRPAAFGASDAVGNGAQLFVAEGTRALRVTSLVSGRDGAVSALPAERYPYQWALASASALPSPVFGAGGDLLALTNTNGATPIHMGGAFVQSVFRDGVATYAGFGATVVDLSAALNMDATLAQGRDDGALVMSVLRNGPAASVGITAGDIVTAVDDVRVNGATSLAELLRLYRQGDRASLTVFREGAAERIDVTFGAYGDLVY